MRITLIAAIARNRVIGRDGRIPWHIPGDLPRFKQLTMGHPVVMGRRTWDSLGRALPGRRNIVLSRSRGFQPTGAEVFPTLGAALEACAGAQEVFVIGGTEAYREALAVAHRLVLTEIDADVPGDATFPPFDRAAWRETSRETHEATEAFAHRFAYVCYDRL